MVRKWAIVARGQARGPGVLSYHDVWEQKPILPYPRSVKYRARAKSKFLSVIGISSSVGRVLRISNRSTGAIMFLRSAFGVPATRKLSGPTIGP